MAERTHKPLDDVDGPIAPLYDRLPRGPHQLGRGEVAQNQRHRMHGAMVEAVAANGYARTSVKQVVSLAGVSRRAFYEQFDNKQDCFLTTIDLVASRAAARIGEAHRSTEGGVEERMRAALATFAQLVNANPKSAKLALIDASSAGPPGWMRLTRMMVALEQMLDASFVHTPGADPVPKPVVRGIAGGLRRLAFTRLRDGRTHELIELVEDMLSWTLAMQSVHATKVGATPLGPAAAGALRPLRPAALGTRSAAQERAGAGAGASYVERYRLRILDSALHMAALEGYEKLTPARIVDHAGVSIDAFFNSFADVQECFVQALQQLSEGVQDAIADQALDSDEWPLAVPRALERLLRHLAGHPARAHMIAMGALEMGSPGIEPNLRLASEVSRQLTAGARGDQPSAVVQECVAGAIWHTVYCHAATRKIEKLPAAASHLAYVVLAPLLGAERAIGVLTAERQRHHAPLRGQRVKRLGARVGSAATL